MGKFTELLRVKKREFTNKRGRMGRSRFFVNFCLVHVFVALYVGVLYLVVNGMDEMGLPRLIYNNVYYLSVGALFIIVAFGSRAIRLKRLRDIGLPLWTDLPLMFMLLANGLGPIFYFFDIPYLRNLDVVGMPENVRDLLGVFWLIWFLVLILAPSKRKGDLFHASCSAKLEGEAR